MTSCPSPRAARFSFPFLLSAFVVFRRDDTEEADDLVSSLRLNSIYAISLTQNLESLSVIKCQWGPCRIYWNEVL